MNTQKVHCAEENFYVFFLTGRLQRVMKLTDNNSNLKIIIISKKLSYSLSFNTPFVEVAVRN